MYNKKSYMLISTILGLFDRVLNESKKRRKSQDTESHI